MWIPERKQPKLRSSFCSWISKLLTFLLTLIDLFDPDLGSSRAKWCRRSLREMYCDMCSSHNVLLSIAYIQSNKLLFCCNGTYPISTFQMCIVMTQYYNVEDCKTWEKFPKCTHVLRIKIQFWHCKKLLGPGMCNAWVMQLIPAHDAAAKGKRMVLVSSPFIKTPNTLGVNTPNTLGVFLWMNV